MSGQPDTGSPEFEPRIVAFVCNWCTYAGADLAGTSRLQYPANVRLVKLPCTGRIDPLFVLKAFEGGADGVLVSGCHPGDCHYTSGNYHARRRWTVLRDLLGLTGIDDTRLVFSWVSAAEGQKFATLIRELTAQVKAAGPFARANPGLRRLDEALALLQEQPDCVSMESEE
jgi:F420-non-reducing hydrogenase iron-sulfur subunit